MKFTSIDFFNHFWKAFRIAIISAAAIILLFKAAKADALGHPIDIEIGIAIAIEECKREKYEADHRFDKFFTEENENKKEPEKGGTLNNRDRD